MPCFEIENTEYPIKNWRSTNIFRNLRMKKPKLMKVCNSNVLSYLCYIRFFVKKFDILYVIPSHSCDDFQNLQNCSWAKFRDDICFSYIHIIHDKYTNPLIFCQIRLNKLHFLKICFLLEFPNFLQCFSSKSNSLFITTTVVSIYYSVKQRNCQVVLVLSQTDTIERQLKCFDVVTIH